MSTSVRIVEYYHATVKDRPGAAYELLQTLATEGVNLLAFHAIPMGPERTQLMIFPEDTEPLLRAAGHHAIALQGPEHAFLVQGDDRLGALASIHRRLYDARINVYASGGLSDGRGGFGYLVYVKPDDCAAAERVLLHGMAESSA